MKQARVSSMMGAVKRSIVIIILFTLAFLSARLWPQVNPGDGPMPVIDGVINESEYPIFHRIGDIGLSFNNDEEFGYFALTSPGQGWVAIGFSPADFHLGANFLFFAVVDGETVVSDQYGVERFAHESDLTLGGTVDIVEYAGFEDEGTIVEFKFRLNSEDQYDSVLEAGESYPIMVSYNESNDDFQVKHTRMYRHILSLFIR